MAERQLLESDGHYAPDAGLAAIAAGFEARAGAAAIGGGAEAGMPRAPHAQPLVKPSDTWLLDLPIGFLNAAGTIDENVVGPDWGPPTGWAWRLTEVTVLFGAGTTLVAFYKNSASGRLLFQTSQSGLWEPSRLYLSYSERLVAVATGGGVTISPSGERVSLHFLPTYLA